MEHQLCCIPTLAQLPSPVLKHRLEYLLQSLPSRWIYAIFWSISTLNCHPSENAAADAPHAVVSWSDGVLRSSETQGRPGASAETIAIPDVEWFYLASQQRLYSIGVDCATVLARSWVSGLNAWLSGEMQLQISGCDRCKEALHHGIRTLVCVPTSNGVLELASTEVSVEDWCLVQLAEAALSPGTNAGSEPAGGEHGAARLAASCRDMKSTRKSQRSGQVSGSQAEAERHRREKLKRRLYQLRSVVPIVTKMDRASVLEDAVAYIKQLRDRVRELETEVDVSRRVLAPEVSSIADAGKINVTLGIHGGGAEKVLPEVKVTLLEGEAVIVVTSSNKGHPAARMTEVLRALDMRVSHASMSMVGERLVQKVVARPPAGVQTEEELKEALLSRLESLMDDDDNNNNNNYRE